MKHKHAELMALYAQDAMETDRPWERWEIRKPGEHHWEQVVYSPRWSSVCEYRRKPKVICINGYDVPEPLREPPRRGQEYWVPCFFPSGRMSELYRWDDDRVDKSFLSRGLIHLTQEAAEAHARALLSFTSQEDKS